MVDVAPPSSPALQTPAQTAWHSRLTTLLESTPGPVLVVASRLTGIDLIVSELGSPTRPLLWLKFDTYDYCDPVSQGSKLADSVAVSLGSPLFGHGLPLNYGTDVLARFHSAIGPLCIVLSNAHLAPDSVQHFLPLAGLGSRLIVVADRDADLAEVQFGSVIESMELRLTESEATEWAAGCSTKIDHHALLACADGYVLPFVSRWRAECGHPPLLIPEPHGATFEDLGESVVEPKHLVDALLNRGAASEAFELAVRSRLQLADDLIARAGRVYFDRGQYRRAFRLLDGLGRRVRGQSDELMRWYFAAATAVNEHVRVKAEIQEHLMMHEAPELRALFAGAFPDQDLLAETQRALDAAETPLTLRMHAFALSQHAGGDDGAKYLFRALRMAEALGHADMVMACASGFADFWVKRGAYRDAVEWARWSLDWHVRRSLRDEVRRLAVLSLSCFARMLIGDIFDLESSLQELDINLTGIPTMESTVSTRADWCLLNGNFPEAVRLYGEIVEQTSRGQWTHAALDLVHALACCGDVSEATAVARRASALTARSSGTTRAVAELALGAALSGSDPAAAQRHLEASQCVLATGALAHRLAQASIALAKLHVRAEREEDARHALAVGEPGLRELGFTGWTLLGGFDPEIKTLYHMFRGETTELELSFLGKERITYRGRALNLGLRQCECLVVLASRPDGVAAERLGIDVYGDTVNHSTLKAIVSRLRQAIPVQSRPYRLGVSVWADFVEVQRLLETGRVREAMSLYRGPLLPRSDAPAVVELRDHIDESIRRAVLRSGDVEALLQLAKQTEVDLELYEAALERLSPNDPRFAIVRARVEQVRRSWAHA
jgi:tetratricopeptide (TPR) repeat protein